MRYPQTKSRFSETCGSMQRCRGKTPNHPGLGLKSILGFGLSCGLSFGLSFGLAKGSADSTLFLADSSSPRARCCATAGCLLRSALGLEGLSPQHALGSDQMAQSFPHCLRQICEKLIGIASHVTASAVKASGALKQKPGNSAPESCA